MKNLKQYVVLFSTLTFGASSAFASQSLCNQYQALRTNTYKSCSFKSDPKGDACVCKKLSGSDDTFYMTAVRAALQPRPDAAAAAAPEAPAPGGQGAAALGAFPNGNYLNHGSNNGDRAYPSEGGGYDIYNSQGQLTRHIDNINNSGFDGEKFTGGSQQTMTGGNGRYTAVPTGDGQYELTTHNRNGTESHEIVGPDDKRLRNLDYQNTQAASSGSGSSSSGGSSGSSSGGNMNTQKMGAGCMSSQNGHIVGAANCAGTDGMIQGAQIANMLGQTIGSQVVSTVGQNQLMNAQMSGKASDTYKGASKAAKTAARYETLTAMGNLAITNSLMNKSKAHKQSAQNIGYDDQRNNLANINRNLEIAGSQATQLNNELRALDGALQDKEEEYADLERSYRTADPAQKAAIQQQLNNLSADITKARRDYRSKEKAFNDAVARKQELVQQSTAVRAAASEQIQYDEKAKTASFMTMTQGLQQMVKAADLNKQAKENQMMARNIEITEAKEKCALNPTLPECPGNGNGDHEVYCTLYPSAPTCQDSSNSGGAWNDDTSDQSGLEVTSENPNLWGAGDAADDPESLDLSSENTAGPEGPAPGNFTPQAAAGKGGAAGSVSVGSPSGGGAAGPSDDPKSQYANGFEGKDKYDSAGVMRSGGNGGGIGGKPADTGIDLNGLLAKFLPGEDKAEESNGILRFGEGGGANRGPASEGSFLDKNANIFDRIHQTYQDKNGRGIVGI